MMEIKRSIQLTTEPLDIIIQEGNSIDFRLDEDVWSDLLVGDVVEFWEDFSGWDKVPSAQSRKVKVKIKEIFRAETFAQLMDDLPNSFVRKEGKDKVITDLRKWWTSEKEREIGVLGFRVEIAY